MDYFEQHYLFSELNDNLLEYDDRCKNFKEPEPEDDFEFNHTAKKEIKKMKTEDLFKKVSEAMGIKFDEKGEIDFEETLNEQKKNNPMGDMTAKEFSKLTREERDKILKAELVKLKSVIKTEELLLAELEKGVVDLTKSLKNKRAMLTIGEMMGDINV